MTRVAATEEQEFAVSLSPEEVYRFFSDVGRLRPAMLGVELCERLPGGQVRWVLQERIDKGIRFRPDFTVVYEGNGRDHVRCRSAGGNMGDDWDVWITPVSGGSMIRLHETVAPDLPITAAMVLLIRPLLVRELRKDVAHFVERARTLLSQPEGRSSVSTASIDVAPAVPSVVPGNS